MNWLLHFLYLNTHGSSEENKTDKVSSLETIQELMVQISEVNIYCDINCNLWVYQGQYFVNILC